MPFKDYAELVDPLVLPINGKPYTIPPVGLAEGIELQDMFEAQDRGDKVKEKPAAEFNRLVLGSAYDDMLADNVPWPSVRRAVLTALADFQRGRAVAEVIWETESDPKAIEQWVKERTNREQRRTKASTTPRRASGTTRTRTPKKA